MQEVPRFGVNKDGMNATVQPSSKGAKAMCVQMQVACDVIAGGQSGAKLVRLGLELVEERKPRLLVDDALVYKTKKSLNQHTRAQTLDASHGHSQYPSVSVTTT